jgi:NAD(P)-dependent dehydrogenase (short-subunit alcohol dehydrogenase family)
MSWVLITGGAAKLGAELSKRISESFPVVIHYHKSKEGAENVKKLIVEKGGKAETIFGDYSTQEGVASFLKEYKERFADTQGYIHNASLYHFGSFLKTPLDDALKLWHVNFFSAEMIAQELQASIKEKKGLIVHLGVAGIQNVLSDTRTSVYTLSKLSLWMLTKSLAKELAPFGVRVNMVSPGYLADSVDLPKESAPIPMGRLGEAEEIASTVLFLLDPKSSYITGQNIEVAGGVRL